MTRHRFQRGDFVAVGYGGQAIEAIVTLASPNGLSLMLSFDGALHTPQGGMFVGLMPVLMDEAGDYRDLSEDEIVRIEPIARAAEDDRKGGQE
jgi:hypothetical protein